MVVALPPLARPSRPKRLLAVCSRIPVSTRRRWLTLLWRTCYTTLKKTCRPFLRSRTSQASQPVQHTRMRIRNRIHIYICTRKQLRIPPSTSLILFERCGSVWSCARYISFIDVFHIERLFLSFLFLFLLYLSFLFLSFFLVLVQVQE